MTQQDVYLLALCEPYEEPGHPVPFNAVVVHAKTLLHPAVPQPDGGLIYRCLTEFPARESGPIVPLSTLTHELDGGRLWDEIGDWEQVVESLVAVARGRACDAMPIGLPSETVGILAHGPAITFTFYYADGVERESGPADRQQELDALNGYLDAYIAQGAFWPGDNLVAPPVEPRVLPYQPWTPSEGPDAPGKKRWGWASFLRPRK